MKVPTTTVLGKKCTPYKSCKTVPKKCYHPKTYYPQPPYIPKPMPHYIPKPAPKPCFTTKCVVVKLQGCKLTFIIRQQKVCTPKKYKCGYKYVYGYHAPKYCVKSVCKTISIKTPKRVCTPTTKKQCYKVPKKCPKKYY